MTNTYEACGPCSSKCDSVIRKVNDKGDVHCARCGSPCWVDGELCYDPDLQEVLGDIRTRMFRAALGLGNAPRRRQPDDVPAPQMTMDKFMVEVTK